MKTRRSDNYKSVYDNVECTESNQSIVTTTVSSSNSSLASSSLNSSALNVTSSNENNNFDFSEQLYPFNNKIKYISCIEPRNLLMGNNSDEKPPLPPKKNKHSKYKVIYSHFILYICKLFTRMAQRRINSVEDITSYSPFHRTVRAIRVSLSKTSIQF